MIKAILIDSCSWSVRQEDLDSMRKVIMFFGVGSCLIFSCTCNNAVEMEEVKFQQGCYAIFNCEESIEYAEICFLDSVYYWSKLDYFIADEYKLTAGGVIYIGAYEADKLIVKGGTLCSRNSYDIVVPIEFPDDLRREFLFSTGRENQMRIRTKVGYSRLIRANKVLEKHCEN